MCADEGPGGKLSFEGIPLTSGLSVILVYSRIRTLDDVQFKEAILLPEQRVSIIRNLSKSWLAHLTKKVQFEGKFAAEFGR